MSKLFDKLLSICKGDVIELKETLLAMDKELNMYIHDAKKNGVDMNVAENFMKEYGLNDLPLEKFYHEEAKFRLKEYFCIPNPSYDLLDEIVTAWFDNEEVLNYSILDDVINDILNESSVYHLYYMLDEHEFCDSFDDLAIAEMYCDKYVNDGIYDYVILKQLVVRKDFTDEYSLELYSWYKEEMETAIEAAKAIGGNE